MKPDTLSDHECLVKIKDVLLNQPYVKRDEKIKMITSLITEQSSIMESDLDKKKTSDFIMVNEDEHIMF